MKRTEYTLTLTGPLISRTNEIAAFGIDLPMARDRSGRPFLPGSHVWGKIRDALIALESAAPKVCRELGWDVERWIGGYRQEEGGAGPDAGQADWNVRRQIHVDDFKATKTAADPGVRTRVAIDPVSGATQDRALQHIETPWDAGEAVTMTGTVTFMMPDGQAETAKKAVEKALNWTLQMGALGSVGFGRLQMAEAGSDETPRHFETIAGNPVSLDLRLDFRGAPFLIAESREREIGFVGSETIPGGAIKGALINLLNAMAGGAPGSLSAAARERFPNIAGRIDEIRLTHLLPSRLGRRPCAVALSQYWADGELADAVDRLPGSDAVASFESDWNEQQRARAREAAGLPARVRRELRLRTAIDPRARSAATEQLFGYELCQTDGLTWHGRIDLTEVPDGDRPDLIAELQSALAGGLPGIGRNKSYAAADLSAAQSPVANLSPQEKYVIELQAPALLRAPEQSYEEAFRELSGGRLECHDQYVSERLAGANFLAMRYFKGRAYRPYLLSEPGSVFVLEAAGDAAEASDTIRAWIAGGLRLSETIRSAYGCGEDFESCPFVPENGYGEVRVRPAS